jgi:hypothetical protein
MRSRTSMMPSARSGNRFARNPSKRAAALHARTAAIVAAAVLMGFGAGLRAQAIPPELRQFLAENARFDENDLRDLAAGKPVAKLLETKYKNEVAGVGAIRIAVPRDFFLAELEDIVRYKQAQANPAPEVGKFGSPPRLAELDALSLEPREIDSLRGCRPGRCGLKLPGAAIKRFKKEIDWSANGADESANRLFREFLLSRLEAYLKSGDAALTAYHDKRSPVSLVSGLHELIARDPYLASRAPRLSECLERFPVCDASVRSFLYWSKEEFGHGLQPVISLSQVLLDREGTNGNGWVWQASKQLYANHYLDCSLALTILVDSGENRDEPTLYLVYLNRSRSDVLKGSLGGLVRGFVQGGVNEEMSDRLERIRKWTESQWAARTSQIGLGEDGRVAVLNRDRRED